MSISIYQVYQSLKALKKKPVTMITQCRIVIVTSVMWHTLLRSPGAEAWVRSVPRIPRHFLEINTARFQSSASASAEDTVKVPKRFVAYPFDYRQEIDVKIETITNRGLGIARVSVPPNDREEEAVSTDTGSKWVVMVPNVIPGETVRARVFRNFNNYSEADLVEVLVASPDRVEPACPLATDCGGCQFQHMSIESQRNLKTQHTRDALAQYGILDKVEVLPCYGTDEVLGYRSKLTPHYQQPSKSRRGVPNDETTSAPEPKMITAIGFQRQSARQIVDVPSCLIATPEVDAAYQKRRAELMGVPPTRKKGATLLFRQANLGEDLIESNHKEMITTVVNGLKFTYRAGNFFQNNYYVLPFMVEQVVEKAIAGGGMTHMADCYCGSGLFGLSASKHFQRVVGIEINEMAINEATKNAEANNITNCEFKAASAENIFSVIADFPREMTAVVLDPPRKGCSEEFLEQLYDFAPRRIVYMSCDVTTQARDAAGIVAAGYDITSVQPFDLFPQTRHIECLMILDRRN